MPGRIRVKAEGNRRSKLHFAVQKLTGVSPNSQRGSDYLIWQHWLQSSKAHLLYHLFVIKILTREFREVFFTLTKSWGDWTHLSSTSQSCHIHVFCLLCIQVQMKVKDSCGWGERNESKRDSSIAVLIALSTKRRPNNGPRLSTYSKRITCFYTDLFIKIVAISCFRGQASIDNFCLLSTRY